MTVSGLSGDDLVGAARDLAVAKHSASRDKAGRPYIGHPARVAARVTDFGPEAAAVAWMHDLIEDTDVTATDLRELGFPETVVRGVIAMTKLPGDQDGEAIRRACADPIALVVKAADVADNTDPVRVAQLDPEQRDRLTAKYAKYRKVLDDHAAPVFPATVQTPSPW